MRFSKGFFLFFILIILLSACSDAYANNKQEAENGVLDLRDWDSQLYGTIQLDGQWEFYWSQFLTHKDLQNVKPDLFATIPESWDGYEIDGINLPGQGYATYRLHIKTNLPENTALGLRPYVFSSAYKLYINQTLVAANGEVAVVPGEEIGEYKPQAVFFNVPAKEFDIIIQVSNFQYARGGFWYSMSMGTPEKILDLHDTLLGKELFLIGGLLVIAMFNLAIYILRRELKYALYFSGVCLFMAIALDMVGQYVLVRLSRALGIPCAET
ncbi:hypothetical protein [Desulfosporosinus sp. BICA1-9]|uniref:hypothetical protein n=1 Tax=Desulfosporosinus sp. BICA1-9 TaxID=1531958 RepID=UPI00054B779F|nr:hypothetical protein [Desulfosporosinus sp. BICA1-9]KJS49238.1 MAG: hypothetical protein VR66_09580 [Peptococcaceae bacterium BRH_c23]KJS84938.1 MAG: hypothetical protein JL57_19935 [Desulfosporosinus sp. BICA1-9]HBW34581.1 hypothetical protein [Desulfosporosinus sp.]